MKRKYSLYGLAFGILAIFLGMSFCGAYYNDEVRLLINGANFDNGDSKIFLLVDVPSTGGAAIRYIMYEVENSGLGDDWYFNEYSTLNWGVTEIYLNEFDYIIIINTNSDGSGGYDEFSISLTVYDSGASYTSESVSFGDAQTNLARIAIWQFQDFGQLKLANNGGAVAWWDNNVSPDHYHYWSGGFEEYDWYFIYGYLDDCFGGNEQEIEDLLLYYNFPDPYPN